MATGGGGCGGTVLGVGYLICQVLLPCVPCSLSTNIIQNTTYNTIVLRIYVYIVKISLNLSRIQPMKDLAQYVY